MSKSNVPNIRIMFRESTLKNEHIYLNKILENYGHILNTFAHGNNIFIRTKLNAVIDPSADFATTKHTSTEIRKALEEMEEKQQPEPTKFRVNKGDEEKPVHFCHITILKSRSLCQSRLS